MFNLIYKEIVIETENLLCSWKYQTGSCNAIFVPSTKVDNCNRRKRCGTVKTGSFGKRSQVDSLKICQSGRKLLCKAIRNSETKLKTQVVPIPSLPDISKQVRDVGRVFKNPQPSRLQKETEKDERFSGIGFSSSPFPGTNCQLVRFANIPVILKQQVRLRDNNCFGRSRRWSSFNIV